ncbi:MAG: hypothetical protein AAGI11_13490 [Pseudomonadota bacterium]
MQALASGLSLVRAGGWLWVPLMLLLQGCLVRVVPGIGGTINSEILDQRLVGECNPVCQIEVSGGGDLNLQLEAVPDSGFEFFRWTDNLGGLISMCPNVVDPQCLVSIDGLNPALVGLTLELVAEFILYNGYDFNIVAYSAGGTGGTFIQQDELRWVEAVEGGITFQHELVTRAADRIVLEDASRGRVTAIRFDLGQVLIQIGDAEPQVFGLTEAQSGRPSGFLIDGLSYNNPLGVHTGTLEWQGGDSWLDRDPRGKRDDVAYTESVRDQDFLTMARNSDGAELTISFANGLVEISTGGPSQLVGFLRSSSVPVTGWNLSSLEYAEIGGEDVTGRLRETAINTWADFDPQNGGQRTSYTELSRGGSVIRLQENGTVNEFIIDLAAGQFIRAPFFGQAAEPLFDIISSSNL